MDTRGFIEVYERIQLATTVRKQSELAKVLGVRPPCISEAKRRNVIPPKWYILLHDKFGLSQDWLHSGIGPMYASARQEDAPQAPPDGAEYEEQRQRVQGLEKENAHLKRTVADLSLKLFWCRWRGNISGTARRRPRVRHGGHNRKKKAVS